MLQHLRDNSKGLVSGILIGLLVIIFAVSGAEALFQWDASATKAVTVNGETISESDVARGIVLRKQQILSQYGESVPAEYLTDEKLRQPVIDGLIQKTLLTQAAKEAGLAANMASIHQQILATPQFQKEGGVFDQERYVSLLRNLGYTPLTYQKVLAEETVVNQVQAGITGSSFVTPAELKSIIGLSFQTRDFSYAVIPAAKVEKSIVVEDADIKAHYDANPQSYTTPEQVAVDYIELSVEELAKGVTVSDDEVQKQFEQNTKAFIAKTERQAAHILLDGKDAQKRVEEVKAKLTAGEDFAKLAKEYSTDSGSKDQGGDLGVTTGDTFPTEFEAALAKLKVGEVSAPVKTDAGVHIIKLISERGTAAPKFEESKTAIIDQLKRAKAESEFAAKLEKLKDVTYNADKLADAAKDLGLTAQNTGLFAKTGGKDLTANSLFVDAAFSADVLEQGNSSDVIELDPTRVVVLKKTERKPAQLQPLETVKDQITTIVRGEKIQALLAKQASEFVSALNSGKAIADHAKEAGVDVKTVTGISRTDRETDREILQYAFTIAAPVGEKAVAGSVRTATGDYAVVSLAAVHLAGEDKVPAEQRASISTQLANINGSYELKSFQSHLEEVAKIKRK